MTARSALPSDLAESFRVATALEAGASPKRLRAKDLVQAFRGGRSIGTDRRRALAPLMRADQAFAGPTAASIHGIPLPRRWEDDPALHVVSLAGDRMRRPGVRGTRASIGRIVHVDGIPVLDPPSTWVSLGGLLGLDDLVAAADRIIGGDGRRPRLAETDELAVAVASAGRRAGVVDLRAALRLMRPGAWSRPETLLRLLIVRSGLPEPEPNPRVVLRGGRIVHPDLAWRDRRIAIEYDGSAFHGRGAWDADALRHELLIDDGWTVVRVRADDLFRHRAELVERLRRRRADARS